MLTIFVKIIFHIKYKGIQSVNLHIIICTIIFKNYLAIWHVPHTYCILQINTLYR